MDNESGLAALIGAQMDAAMAKLEVRLIDRFAGKKELEILDKRVDMLEQSQASARALSTFQRWLVGTVGVGALGAVATLVWLATS